MKPIKVQEKECIPVCPENISILIPIKKDARSVSQREVFIGRFKIKRT